MRGRVGKGSILQRIEALEARSTDDSGLAANRPNGWPSGGSSSTFTKMAKTESDVDENDPNTLVVVVEYVDMPAKATSGAGTRAAGLATRIATDIDK